ncbi:MAG: ice-binding family protein [bacterium]|nr:ice-binding family protein [bacterium]
MKMFFSKISLVISVTVFLFGLALPADVAKAAAISPNLGTTASTYSILAGSEVTNAGASTISGNVGISPGVGIAPHYTGFGTVTLGGIINDANAAALSAKDEKDTAYTALDQGCDTTYVGATKDLAGLTLVPGVYCADKFDLTGTLTLSGTSSDIWIFKSASSLVLTGGAAVRVVFTGGGLACNVWWRVVSSATFDANSTLVGNILSGVSVTLADGASLNGRAFAGTAAVTLVGNTISGPTCTAAAAPGSGSSGGSTSQGTINVVKTVINDNGGTSTVADFPLFINGLLVVSGQTNTYPAYADNYFVTETNITNYTRTFSGDCDANGRVQLLTNGQNKFCIVTNNDIGAPIVVPPVPPLIDVVKVPSPLALPAGPGVVVYTYTLRNIGTVPMANVTMVGDTCSPIVLASGDTNGDAKLDVNEIWVHTCSTTLAKTHTNTVVATGWANGIAATDIASATVVVGLPVVPPLIHVTKIPSPLTLFAGGGMVTYTNTVTNPGVVALSDVNLSDDKCGPVNHISGDTNNDAKLDTTETWVYTCKTKLTQTTTNTVVADGTANGLTARDFALATVVVATVVPKLPNTGMPPDDKNYLSIIIAFAGISAVFSLIFLKKRTI